MTTGPTSRSVFGGIDQERILASFDTAVDDGLDSGFFDDALAEARDTARAAPDSDPDVIDFDRLDADARRAFILQGPGGLG